MIRGIAVMRRRADSYVNATQILKVAGIDKGRRTKILEKEILPGKHEIVQGGYGKYQGTWSVIPTQFVVDTFGLHLFIDSFELGYLWSGDEMLLRSSVSPTSLRLFSTTCLLPRPFPLSRHYPLLHLPGRLRDLQDFLLHMWDISQTHSMVNNRVNWLHLYYPGKQLI